jgi:hypothetical protein
LVKLVSDSKVCLTSEHHHVASHEVKHDVIQRGHESFLVDNIEVYILISDDLYPIVAFDVL